MNGSPREALVCVKKCKVGQEFSRNGLRLSFEQGRVCITMHHGRRTMLKKLTVLSGALIALVAAGLSQENTSGVSGLDAIAARQASLDMSSITFHSMSDAMKAGREAKSQGYPAAVLAKWAKALPRMFPAGTGMGETSATTQARVAIWRDRASFDQAAANYADATAKLAALAASNDTTAFTSQLEAVNQACNACHARYKAGDQGPPRK
jgi:cytochrome c556